MKYIKKIILNLILQIVSLFMLFSLIAFAVNWWPESVPAWEIEWWVFSKLINTFNISDDTVKVNKKMYVNWEICVIWDDSNKTCIKDQKWDPLYIRSISWYEWIYPTNSTNDGWTWIWIKKEWDEYGKIWCQVYQDKHGTWTNQDVINCQESYDWRWTSLQSIIDWSGSESTRLTWIDYQIMWWNPWVPHDCEVITNVHICSWATMCWVYPWQNKWNPDYLIFACIWK